LTIVFLDFVEVKTTKSQELEHEAFLLKLGQRIVALRKKDKLSQNDLAYRIGWDKPNLRKIEHGKGNPTVKSLLLIAEGLGVTFQELTDF
jgi:transcriptional regulator with XRE-family HTH domain